MQQLQLDPTIQVAAIPADGNATGVKSAAAGFGAEPFRTLLATTLADPPRPPVSTAQTLAAKAPAAQTPGAQVPGAQGPAVGTSSAEQTLAATITEQLHAGASQADIVNSLAAKLASSVAQTLGASGADARGTLQTMFANALAPPSTGGDAASPAALAQQFMRLTTAAESITSQQLGQQKRIAGNLLDALRAKDIPARTTTTTTLNATGTPPLTGTARPNKLGRTVAASDANTPAQNALASAQAGVGMMAASLSGVLPVAAPSANLALPTAASAVTSSTALASAANATAVLADAANVTAALADSANPNPMAVPGNGVPGTAAQVDVARAAAVATAKADDTTGTSLPAPSDANRVADGAAAGSLAANVATAGAAGSPAPQLPTGSAAVGSPKATRPLDPDGSSEPDASTAGSAAGAWPSAAAAALQTTPPPTAKTLAAVPSVKRATQPASTADANAARSDALPLHRQTLEAGAQIGAAGFPSAPVDAPVSLASGSASVEGDGRTVDLGLMAATQSGGDTLLGRTLTRAALVANARQTPVGATASAATDAAPAATDTAPAATATAPAATAPAAISDTAVSVFVKAFEVALKAGLPADNAPAAQHDPTAAPMLSLPGHEAAGSLTAFVPAVAPFTIDRAAVTAASAAPAVPVPVDHSAIADQVLRGAFMRNVGQSSEMRLTLVPDSLGDVTVKLVVDAGNVSAHVVAQTSDVRDALVAAQPQLVKSLADSGLKLTSFTVDLQNGGFAGFSQQNDQSQSGHRPRQSANAADVDDAGDTPLDAIPSFAPSSVAGSGAGYYNYLA